MTSNIFKGRNFMTPDIIEYGHTKNGLKYELSEGRGFNNDKIFGVTVGNKLSTEVDHDKSDMFYSLQDARDYINTIQKGNKIMLTSIITEIRYYTQRLNKLIKIKTKNKKLYLETMEKIKLLTYRKNIILHYNIKQ